jgi:hypothetical protein
MTVAASPDSFDTRFTELASRWISHQNLRLTDPGIADLAQSRIALDDARSRIRELAIAV